jgi:hypothetical protein
MLRRYIREKYTYPFELTLYLHLPPKLLFVTLDPIQLPFSCSWHPPLALKWIENAVCEPHVQILI